MNKSNRKIVAFICLILAAKFASDMKRAEINVLIEVCVCMNSQYLGRLTEH